MCLGRVEFFSLRKIARAFFDLFEQVVGGVQAFCVVQFFALLF